MDHIKIANNHIESRKSKKFNPVDYTTPEDMSDKLNSGHTFEFILYRIEDTLVNPFDVFDAHNGKISSAYREAVKIGFQLFTNKLQTWKH